MKLPYCLLLACLWSLSLSIQAQTAAATPNLNGTWEGTMTIGPNSFLLAFTIVNQDGTYSATFTSRDMGVYGMPADSVEVRDNRIVIRVRPVDGEFNGNLRLDTGGGAFVRIDGDWFQQGEMLPMVLLPVDKPTL
ncbi:MAG: hypothetical protein RLZZ385_1338 [Pseudomonadota bacterium]|jgi:hypothetical protein